MTKAVTAGQTTGRSGFKLTSTSKLPLCQTSTPCPLALHPFAQDNVLPTHSHRSFEARPCPGPLCPPILLLYCSLYVISNPKLFDSPWVAGIMPYLIHDSIEHGWCPVVIWRNKYHLVYNN